MVGFRFGGAIVLAAISWAVVAAQTTTPRGSAQTSSPIEEFNKQHAEWKQILATLRDYQLKYQKADANDRPALKKQFDDTIANGKELFAKLITVAERAYLSAPNQHKEISEFLSAAANDTLLKDNFEEALRLSRVLIDNNYGDQGIYNLAGVAAFNANEFDASEKYLLTAASSGGISKQGKDILGVVKEHQDHWRTEKSLRDAEAKSNNLPRIKLTISDSKGKPRGDIVLELFENEAPNTVANFINLVEKKYYDGLKFHRVLPGFMAQGGDPKGDGTGGPGYHIACECDARNARRHFRGSLSMAHAGKDTGGSQFFLTFAPTEQLDGKHTVFGRVIEGFDLLSKIQRNNPDRPSTTGPDRIEKAVVVRKQPGKRYEPKKIDG